MVGSSFSDFLDRMHQEDDENPGVPPPASPGPQPDDPEEPPEMDNPSTGAFTT